MSKKHKNNCTTLNYVDCLLILTSAFTRCVSIFDFTSIVGIPIAITSSLKIFALTAGIQKYKSIIKKMRWRSMIK